MFSVNQFGKWFIEQYRFIQMYQKHNDAILRVVDIEEKTDLGEPVFTIQLVGKNYFVDKPLTELLSHPGILEAFSKRDVEAIVRAQTKFELAPKAKIKAHYQCNGSTQVKLEDSNGNSLTESIGAITKNKELLENVSSKDAYLLGYLYGSEES